MEQLNYKIIHGKGKTNAGIFCYIKNDKKNIPVLIIEKEALCNRNHNYINILIMILVISMLIGDREDLVDASALLILPTLMSLILLFITIKFVFISNFF